jgi:UDP-glucose 4-epimerase
VTKLVVGGSGFLGAGVVASLLAAGERVRATSRHPARRVQTAGLEWRCVDLATFDAWPDLLDGISTVYHLGWSTTPASADQRPLADLAENVLGSLRLLEALRGRATRLVFASSGGAVYGRLNSVPVAEDAPTRPISAHGLSKLTTENYIRLYAESFGLDAVVLRIGNAFGPGQAAQPAFGVIAHYAGQALAGEPVVIYGDGSVVRDYVYVNDVVEALLLASRAALSERVLNIGTGRGHSLIELVRVIERASGRSLVVRHEPPRAFDVPVSVLDARRAAQQLGWKARTPLEVGVERTLVAIAGEKERS